MKRIFIAAAILTPLMFGCGGNENGQAEKKAKEYNPIVVTTQTDLELVFDIEKTANGCRVFGFTNLPDSTKLGASLLNRGKVFAQNFEIYTNGGYFEGKFTVKLNKVTSIELVLTDNQFWQSEKILNQLKLVNSFDWEANSMGRQIRYKKDL